jgi:hypothetical protein
MQSKPKTVSISSKLNIHFLPIGQIIQNDTFLNDFKVYDVFKVRDDRSFVYFFNETSSSPFVFTGLSGTCYSSLLALVKDFFSFMPMLDGSDVIRHRAFLSQSLVLLLKKNLNG